VPRRERRQSSRHEDRALGASQSHRSRLRLL
ncbi:MAG: hypothetical protein AVDCRST_MAG44-1636, partial [uncultured Sphingomonas sp.]